MIGTMRLFGMLVALSFAFPVFADGDAAAGKEKAETCRGCHGIENYKNVYPTYKVPKLAGQNAQYIVIALKAYKSGERNHLTMRSHAIPMTEQDMQDIAAYFASQTGAGQ